MAGGGWGGGVAKGQLGLHAKRYIYTTIIIKLLLDDLCKKVNLDIPVLL